MGTTNIFQPVHLTWDGETYTIPSNRVLGAIAIIEDHTTFGELVTSVQQGRVKVTMLANIWAALLTYAGLPIASDEVYAGLYEGDIKTQIVDSVNTLMVLMIPPGVMAAEQRKGDKETGNSPKAKITRAKASSRRSTKR